jgi:predicted kinase
MRHVIEDQILTDLEYPDTKWEQPCLIATFGFPCAGKTATAAKLSSRYPFVCLTTDVIRLTYGFSSGPETLKSMKTVSKKLLSQRYSVIFDGIHMMKKNRDDLRDFGRVNNAQVQFIHVYADEDVIKQRLHQRIENPENTEQQGKYIITDEHFERIISYYEKPEDEDDVIDVDTSSRSLTDGQLMSLYTVLDAWM